MKKSNTLKDIENAVSENKGITFSGLKKELDLANGVLQYHISRSDKLEKKKRAVLPKNACKNCNFRRYCQEECHRKILRDPLKKSIVEGLSNGKTQSQIAEEHNLDKSTLSYHVNVLSDKNVLQNKEPVKPVRSLLNLV